MGCLQLLPTTQVNAIYDSEARILLLRAQGDAQNHTSGIHFVAGTSSDGHDVFQLMGWVGPVSGGMTPYDTLQRFEHMGYPGSFVLVEAGHPGGVRVPVEVVPGAAATAPAPAPEVRRIAVGGELELRAAVWGQRGATQSLKRDVAFLALESAGIQNLSAPEIVWTLRGLATGETQVKLVSIGGVVPVVTSRTVQVIIAPATK